MIGLKRFFIGAGAHYWEPATPMISQCNGILTETGLFLDILSAK